MKNYKYMMNIFLISAAANVALAADVDVIDPTAVLSASPAIISPVASTDAVVLPKTVKVKVPYKIYVSAVINPNITTSNVDAKEIFKMLDGEHKGEVAKFITPEICKSPHVTLFQGEVDIAGAQKADKLKKSLEAILLNYKNTTVTVKDSEVGGMHAGGTNSYFIAYNVNDATSKLREMADLVKCEVGAFPKNYGDYATTMKLGGFAGAFTKHLSSADDSMLHISVLRAFTTHKTHPKYGDGLTKLSTVVDLYLSLRAAITAVFNNPTEEQKNKLVKYALENYDGTTELFGDTTTAPLAGLTYKNTHMTAKLLEAKFKSSFDNIYKKKELDTLDKAKLIVLLDDIIRKPAKFFTEGKVNKPILGDLPAKLLKAKGVYAVDATGAPGENKKADDLCLELQKTMVGDLGLQITGFQVDVSPKAIF